MASLEYTAMLNTLELDEFAHELSPPDAPRPEHLCAPVNRLGIMAPIGGPDWFGPHPPGCGCPSCDDDDDLPF